MLYMSSSRVAAEFAAKLALHSNSASQSITIMQLARSEAYYVHVAIGTLSADTVVKVASNYSWLPIDISTAKRILDGLSRRK